MAFNNRGRAYEKKADHGRAITDYSEAIRLDPKDVIAFNNRGVAYKAKGDLDRASADVLARIRRMTH
jgi:tetratricopeptide (TPR) repeat protein